jgi:hypothetical protein
MGRNFSLKFRVNRLRWSLLSLAATAAAAALVARARDGAITLDRTRPPERTGRMRCDISSWQSSGHMR